MAGKKVCHFEAPYRILQAVLGKGLGKDEDGITRAIRVPLKKDTAGVRANCIL